MDHGIDHGPPKSLIGQESPPCPSSLYTTFKEEDWPKHLRLPKYVIVCNMDNGPWCNGFFIGLKQRGRLDKNSKRLSGWKSLIGQNSFFRFCFLNIFHFPTYRHLTTTHPHLSINLHWFRSTVLKQPTQVFNVRNVTWIENEVDHFNSHVQELVYVSVK